MSLTESPNKSQIIASEKKLLAAFENRDLEILDKLVHEHALFILPNGKTVTKLGVLENYRSGDTTMASILSRDYIINFVDDTAIVSVNIELNGKYFDQAISSTFRYIRIWKLCDGNWKVIAVSGVPIIN